MSAQPDEPTPSALPVVAFLGAGLMGAPMARNVAAAGCEVRLWNRTAAKAEAHADVLTPCRSVADAVRGADVVVTMLYDVDAVAEALGQVGDAAAPGTVWVQQSTVGVAGTERLAALADELDLVLVDAPVLGTRQPAEQGALVVLASGPEAVRERVTPVLDAVGARTMWVGEAGAGSRLKLAANAWVLTVTQGVADSLALTRELGLDPALFLEAVQGGALDAPYVGLKGRAMLAGEHEPSFALAGGVKDGGLILEAAASAGVEMAVLAAVRERMERAVEAGHGDEDLSATYLGHEHHDGQG